MSAIVSIIVPIYNAEASIECCISSIQAQIYKDWKLLLVDDGSTDNSFKICESFALTDFRISLYRKKNGGVSSARNFAIEHVDTPYFVCVDSDDFIEPTYVSELMEAREKFANAGHIWCGFQTVSDYKKSDMKMFIADIGLKYSKFQRNQIMMLHRMWLDSSPWGKLYDTRVVKENKIYMDTNLCLGEDILFNYQYLDVVDSKEIIVINKPLYNYIRIENNSLDHKYYPNLLQMYLDNCKSIHVFLEKWEINEAQWKIYWNDAFYKLERVLRNTMRKENRDTFFEKISYNNNIMRSAEFCEALSNFSDSMNPLYSIAYRTQYYIVIWLLDLLVRIKKCF